MSDKDAIDIESKLVNVAEKHSGQKVPDFNNSNPVSFQFGYSSWHHVRSFAAYSDYPFKKFLGLGKHPYEKPLKPEMSPAVVESEESRKTSYPQLLLSNDNKGFFFPIKLKVPVQTQWGYIGSSIELLDEVNRIQALLSKGEYWHADIDDFISKFQLACQKSMESNLPIVIDG